MKNIITLCTLIFLALSLFVFIEVFPHTNATYEQKQVNTFAARQTTTAYDALDNDVQRLLIEKEVALQERKAQHEMMMDYLWFLGAFVVVFIGVVLHHVRRM